MQLELSGAVLKALAASTSKCRRPIHPRPPIPAGIQDDIRLKNRLRRLWQVTSVHPLKPDLNRLQRSVTRWLNKRRNDQWRVTPESLDPEDQSLWRMIKRVMRVPTPSPPLVTPWGIALSGSKKAETLADSLVIQFQPVTDNSVGIGIFDVAPISYFLAPSSETMLITSDEVHEAISGLKFSKASGPNCIPNKALMHLPQQAVSLLTQIFNADLLSHHFPTVWKHARVSSILKPGKDPALSSSYRPISLLDTIGKLFEKILIARILHE